MKENPSRMDANKVLAADGADALRWRWMVRVSTIAAEKKKLKLSNRKQELAPMLCTNRPAMAGVIICAPWTACDMSAFTDIRPFAGASDRTATDCAGMKNVETVERAQKMA